MDPVWPASMSVLARGRPAICTPLPDREGVSLRYLDPMGGRELIRSEVEIRTCLSPEDAEVAISVLGLGQTA
jgi:hypothetical protein